MLSLNLRPRSPRQQVPRITIIEGALLLAVFIAVRILFGSSTTNWLLGALWLVTTGFFGHLWLQMRRVEAAVPALAQPLRLHRWGALSLVAGFGGLAAAAVCRALGSTSPVLLGVILGVAGTGMVGAVLLQRAARRAPTEADPSSVGTA